MEPAALRQALLLLGGLLAALCLWAAMRADRRRRLIDNLPTSKTTGVFIGLSELKGTTQAEQPLVSFLVQSPCVAYAWTVEEHWSRTVTETYTDSEGKTQTRTREESGWETVASGGQQLPFFYLKDDCGVIHICPERAKVEPRTLFNHTCGPGDPLYYGKGPAHSIPHSDEERHFQETGIPLGASLYVVGQARERADVVAPEIACAPHVPLFLISTRSESRVSAGWQIQFWVFTLVGFMLPPLGLLVRDCWTASHPGVAFLNQAPHPVHVIGRLGPNLAIDQPRAYLLAAAIFIGVWLLAWTWMAFNSMVELRQRVRQAWANVDVHLKRRNDLIPNLVRIIQALRDHERTVQVQLAHLRSQPLATPPGQPGPDPEGCAASVQAVVERYPELKADEGFLSLQKSLVDTEQRIALARDYFSSIATFFNTRLERIPDRFVAALAAMKPQHRSV